MLGFVYLKRTDKSEFDRFLNEIAVGDEIRGSSDEICYADEIRYADEMKYTRQMPF